MAPIHLRTAAELASAYSSGELSPVQVTRALIERIDAWEPRINAMYRLHRDAALEQARAAEARWRQGRPLSPLDGVPITIKENIYTRGDPAPIGTRAYEDAPVQPADAPAAARIREAGCVILGKTTMPDFGMLSSGLSSLHGVTRNPWRLDRNPSGSSSGAVADAAALMSIIARPDARDYMSLPYNGERFAQLTAPEPKRLKIGFLPDMGV